MSAPKLPPLPLHELRRTYMGLFVDKSVGARVWDAALAAHDAEVAAKALEDYADEVEAGEVWSWDADRLTGEVRDRAAALRGGQ